MDFVQYQEAVMRTAGKHHSFESGLAIWALGIAGESGEVADYVKKVLGHGHPLETLKLVKEIGDVLWYCAALADHLGLSLEHIAETNIEKLKARYPDGFSQERSLKREKE